MKLKQIKKRLNKNMRAIKLKLYQYGKLQNSNEFLFEGNLPIATLFYGDWNGPFTL